MACTTNYRGMMTSMINAIEDPRSALHASCVAMCTVGTSLLARAQAAEEARSDIDGADLYALVFSLAWLGHQPGLRAGSARLFGVVVSAVLTDRAPRRPPACRTTS